MSRHIILTAALSAVALGLATPALAQSSARPPAHHDWERVWHKGDHIAGFAYHVIGAYARYGLAKPPAGQLYVALGDQVLLVDATKLVVTRAVGKAAKILG